MSVWGADWTKIINRLIVETDERGGRSIDFAGLVALQSVPICQIEALREDPRGQVVSSLEEAIAEKRKRRDAKRAAMNGGIINTSEKIR